MCALIVWNNLKLFVQHSLLKFHCYSFHNGITITPRKSVDRKCEEKVEKLQESRTHICLRWWYVCTHSKVHRSCTYTYMYIPTHTLHIYTGKTFIIHIICTCIYRVFQDSTLGLKVVIVMMVTIMKKIRKKLSDLV